MDLLRTLFVGAHADDIELFAGALLSRVQRETGNAQCLTFSAHRGITNPRQASKEHHRNMKAAGVRHYLLGDLYACSGEFQAKRQEIYSALEEFPDSETTLVVTHYWGDTNQDHRQVFEEVARVYKGKATILCGSFDYNKVAGEAPNIFMRVTREDVNRKIAWIMNYRSQQREGRHYFRSEAIRGALAHYGSLVGCEYAEPYYLVRGIF